MKHIRTLKADIIFICALLLLSILLYFFLLKGRTSGQCAVVRVNGSVVMRISLEKDGVYSINNGTNEITVSNGKLFMSYADCPDKICMRMGQIMYPGECITCLPNRITVSVDGTGNSDDAYIRAVI